ncbi:hypothetical protein [Xylophilus sp. GOD-11R]|uniref:hypothetical protein n=1 Tax=Xylophilus sp. GOD-11R TaxID=3089814 RepID=UPI00298C5F83|nr:hypothetical protein [Xylophilus sp. GOD-11R]WPB57534.1 hypothetical protein R9X41_02430 [Xylophilus sp. GOD-11R]
MMRLAVSSIRPPAWRVLLAGWAMAACALLAGCGGGVFAGVGSGGSGVAEGTLSGFGSVIVDGVEYSELALADADRSGLKLGQRLRLVFDANNNAQSVEVRPQLRGPVTAALDADGWSRIAGQWVRVVMDNDDISRSGITLLDGFGGTAIAAGQDAVAYGSWAWDPVKASQVLIATRVERLATPADPVLLGGVAMAVGDSGFRLNATNGTAVSATRMPAIGEGTIVSLQVARSGLVADGQGAVAMLAALDVQDASLGAVDLSGYQTIRLGGLANRVDSTGGTVTIQGTTLRVAGGATGFSDGQFVRATAEGGTGSPGPADVRQRGRSPVGMPGDDGTGLVTELKGLLAGVDWTAASVTFVLRGVTVQADAAQIAQACRSAGSSQTLYVVVTGYSPSPVAPLRANAVSCTSDLTAASDV